MTQIATTREQGQRLMACGVKAETADMTLLLEHGHTENTRLSARPYGTFKEPFREQNCIPAWSLSRLLEMMPKKLTVGISVLELGMGFEPFYGHFYLRYTNARTGIDDLESHTEADTPMDACVQMIEWLTQNGYELNKTEDR